MECVHCGRILPVRDGVLHVASREEDPAIDRERRAMLEIERTSTIDKPTDFSLPMLLSAQGPLRDAFLLLPYDNGSDYFRENEYFRNVGRCAEHFDFVMEAMGLPSGSRVLDVAADLTWSTARLARRGWRAVGIDINHHLCAAQVFREAGVDYAVVNVDMHAPAFADGVFDGITAFNALHHTHRLEELVANLTRSLRPGGRLGFVEPYWVFDHTRAEFGVSEIEAGINENVYRLEEWHRVFANAGLDMVRFVVARAFDAVYEKRDAGAPPRALSLDEARQDLFAAHYTVRFTAPACVPGAVRPGESLEIPITVHNRSVAGWASESQVPVVASYHLHRRSPSISGGGTLVTFDNVRTELPGRLDPGADVDVRLRVEAPLEPGDYLVEIDLVHEGMTWFAERGGTTAVVSMRVE